MTIKMLYEQIWPRLVGNDLDILECYDIVFRWHGDKPLQKLYILSPHQPSKDNPIGLFNFLKPIATKECDWIFRDQDKGFPTDPPTRQLPFVGPADQPTVEFQVTSLDPVIQKVTWTDSMSADPDALTAFRATHATLAEVAFGTIPVTKYNPQAPGKTTYHLRLAFRPTVRHLTPSPIPFGPVHGKPFLKFRPCAVFAPSQVLGELRLKLEQLAVDWGEHARCAIEQLFNEIFEKDGTSTRIEDHRVSIVIPPHILLLNPTVLGECSPMMLELPKCLAGSLLPRSCIAGAKHHPHTDPLTLAREVYGYLKHTAINDADAKTKEMISSALSCRSHENVSHVVEVLCSLGFLKPAEGKLNHFLVVKAENTPLLGDDELFMRKVRGDEEINLGRFDTQLRDRLYGKLEVPWGPEKYARFRFPGFSVFYDLAFLPDS
ncbi:MAG: hypothetical protein ABSG86_24010 [Thermoguttaceae bacterium]